MWRCACSVGRRSRRRPFVHAGARETCRVLGGSGIFGLEVPARGGRSDSGTRSGRYADSWIDPGEAARACVSALAREEPWPYARRVRRGFRTGGVRRVVYLENETSQVSAPPVASRPGAHYYWHGSAYSPM